MYFCEDHFEAFDYTKDGKKQLQLQAVPTKNLPVKSVESKPKAERKPPVERTTTQTKSNKELLSKPAYKYSNYTDLCLK